MSDAAVPMDTSATGTTGAAAPTALARTLHAIPQRSSQSPELIATVRPPTRSASAVAAAASAGGAGDHKRSSAADLAAAAAVASARGPSSALVAAAAAEILPFSQPLTQ